MMKMMKMMLKLWVVFVWGDSLQTWTGKNTHATFQWEDQSDVNTQHDEK